MATQEFRYYFLVYRAAGQKVVGSQTTVEKSRGGKDGR
jgi:hypothetical protein